ncbi:MAG: hypothetical protein QM477_08765, partial [Planctomycetota bacterium]
LVALRLVAFFLVTLRLVAFFFVAFRLVALRFVAFFLVAFFLVAFFLAAILTPFLDPEKQRTRWLNMWARRGRTHTSCLRHVVLV